MRRWKRARLLAHDSSCLARDLKSFMLSVAAMMPSNDRRLHGMALLASVFAVAGAEDACLLQTKGREVTYDLGTASLVQCDHGSVAWCLMRFRSFS